MVHSKSNRCFQILAHTICIIFTLFVLLPFLLLFISSFTEEATLMVNGYSYFPKKLSLESYAYIFKNAPKIFRAYGITILVTIIGTFLNILMSSMCLPIIT